MNSIVFIWDEILFHFKKRNFISMFFLFFFNLQMEITIVTCNLVRFSIFWSTSDNFWCAEFNESCNVSLCSTNSSIILCVKQHVQTTYKVFRIHIFWETTCLERPYLGTKKVFCQDRFTSTSLISIRDFELLRVFTCLEIHQKRTYN
jgi:hypothetical protein